MEVCFHKISLYWGEFVSNWGKAFVYCRCGACWGWHVCQCTKRGCHFHEGEFPNLQHLLPFLPHFLASKWNQDWTLKHIKSVQFFSESQICLPLTLIYWSVCVTTEDMPQLERRTLPEIPEKLLWLIAGQWEDDHFRMHSTCSPGHRTCYKDCMPRWHYHASSNPRGKRKDRERVWGACEGGWFWKLPRGVLCFRYLYHGISQEDMNVSLRHIIFSLYICVCTRACGFWVCDFGYIKHHLLCTFLLIKGNKRGNRFSTSMFYLDNSRIWNYAYD